MDVWEELQNQRVKGFEPMLTTTDVSILLRKPQRWVLGVIKSGALKAVKLGGNSYRIQPADYRKFLETGATGFAHAKPSGCGKRFRKKGE